MTMGAMNTEPAERGGDCLERSLCQVRGGSERLTFSTWHLLSVYTLFVDVASYKIKYGIPLGCILDGVHAWII